MPAPASAKTTPTIRTGRTLRRCRTWAMMSVKAGPSVEMVEASIGEVKEEPQSSTYIHP